MTRYDYDVRRPMRRKEADTSGCGVVMVCVVLVCMLAGILLAFAKQVNDRAKAMPPTSVAKVRTDGGGTIRVYSVTIDGTEYLVTDRGGIAERGSR